MSKVSTGSDKEILVENSRERKPNNKTASRIKKPKSEKSGKTFGKLSIKRKSKNGNSKGHLHQAIEKLFNYSDELLCVIETNGYFIKINPAFEKLLGYTEEELQEKPFAEFIHPNDREKTLKVIEEKLKKGYAVKSFSNRYQCKDGTYKWLEWTFNPAPEEGNSAYAVARDITNTLSVIEGNFRKSDRHLTVLNNISNIFLTTPDDKIYDKVLDIVLDVTQSEYGVFGYIDEKGDLVVPAMAGHLRDKCQVTEKAIVFPREKWDDSQWPTAIRQKKTIYSNQQTAKTPIGNIISERSMSVPITHSNGAIGLLQVANKKTDYGEEDAELLESIAEYIAPILSSRIARDIQQRARLEVEKALSESERIHRTLVESLPLKVFLKDANGVYLWANNNYMKGLNLGNNDFKGKTVYDFFPQELADNYKAEDKAIMESRESKTIEEKYIEDGVETWAYKTKTPVIDDKGNIIGLLGLFWDITERKQAEESIRALNEFLEHRTIDLKRSNEELEQFAYVASHDLQEPLRMVASYTQLLANRYKGKLDQDAQDFINYAVDGAKRMQVLINDLLNYSRVGMRGKDFAPTDCFALLGQVINNLRKAIEENCAIITNDDLPTIMADDSQIAQLFQNLIVNAIKYRGKKEPLLHISSKKVGDFWEFSFKDNGIGIDPKYKDAIFVIFKRLHAREEYSGTGIGLAICKKIVERHKGKIWLKSEPGKGSTFYFTIPATRGKNV